MERGVGIDLVREGWRFCSPTRDRLDVGRDRKSFCCLLVKCHAVVVTGCLNRQDVPVIQVMKWRQHSQFVESLDRTGLFVVCVEIEMFMYVKFGRWGTCTFPYKLGGEVLYVAAAIGTWDWVLYTLW